jgi:GNAT superfamily N-acetyltransferase
VRVTTYYLQMLSPGELRPSRASAAHAQVARVATPLPELNRFFYTAVGGSWFWIDRLSWTYAKWHAYLAEPRVETWVLSVAGVPAGYFELDAAAGDPEIAYFGLLPTYVGQGLGGHLLTRAVERAWELGGQRVWLHTCSLDHPAALAAYQARGFALYHTEEHEEDLPPITPGPWPGHDEGFR